VVRERAGLFCQWLRGLRVIWWSRDGAREFGNDASSVGVSELAFRMHQSRREERPGYRFKFTMNGVAI